jgi:hypothetical protein
MSSSAASELAILAQQLAQIQSGELLATAFVQQARAHTQLLAALPEKFPLVYHDLLDRLESGALFSEESCSFSQRDLLDSLQMWIDKAASRLTA